MRTIVKKLEIVANVSIIVVSILLAVALAKHFFFNAPTRIDGPVRNYIRKGQKVALQDVDWAKNGRTLILVLQKDCRFCSESAPFYKTLVQNGAKRSNIHMLAVLPQATDEGKKYLNDLGVAIDDVRQEQLSVLTVEGTPTLILVNDAGVATDVWMGKLKPDKEAEVLSRL